MQVFRAKGSKLEILRELPFRNEAEIQRLVEGNLREIFGLEFVRSEFELPKIRIDTAMSFRL